MPSKLLTSDDVRVRIKEGEEAKKSKASCQRSFMVIGSYDAFGHINSMFIVCTKKKKEKLNNVQGFKVWEETLTVQGI